jgi:ketosteroid isomerase-like protein
MDDVYGFLDAVVPLMREEVTALHSGNLAPRLALWSTEEPVTLFGAELSGRGWAQIRPAFDRLADSFSGSQSCEYDVLAAGASADLGYVVAIERSVAASYGGEPHSYALRVTTVFRREQGSWKIVHRHGDPFDDTARQALAERAESLGPADE